MVVGVLQVRMGSTRLPGKVLLEIMGKPMLLLQIERLLRASEIDKLIIATTTNSDDDQIEELIESIGLECYRGSEDDVLDRYYQAASKYLPEYIVRLTGDDPLTDPELIDKMIQEIKANGCDAVTNTMNATFPEGLDASVITYQALKKAWENAKLSSQREHVTPYILENESLFNVEHYTQENDMSTLRWTVDYQEDFDFVKSVYEALYEKNPEFKSADIYELLDKNPQLLNINNNFKRNEGYLKSLQNDKKVQ